jgi:uncharacterized membrane protein YgdD (TMEM256/DUF423 family)
MAALSPRVAGPLAAVLGFLAVAGGAFAAHAAPDPKAAEWLRIGANWAAIHALAVLACLALSGRWPRAALAPALFLPGILVFTGSLYAMAAGGPRWLGAVTPVGGVLFLSGWVVLAWALAQGESGELNSPPSA